MAQDYYSLLTNIGAARFANAAATQTTLNITKMAFGDGDLDTVQNKEALTALINENYRGNISNILVHQANANWIVIEGLIPIETGGWNIHEIGILDSADNLIAVARVPKSYKPAGVQGALGDFRVTVNLAVTNSALVSMAVDPLTVTASRQYADTLTTTHNADQNAHTVATEVAKGFVELASVAEAQAGTDTERAITPAGLSASFAGLDGWRRRLLLKSLLDAMAQGDDETIINALADPLVDTSLIDVGASTALTHNPARASITVATGGLTADLCVGGTPTASEGTAAAAFDSNPATDVNSAAGGLWVAYEFAAPQTVVQYTIQSSASVNGGKAPGTWTFEGWNGVSWDVLDTQSLPAVAWPLGDVRTYDFANATAYSKYRLNVSACATPPSNTYIAALEMRGTAAPVDMTVISTSRTLSAEPIKGYFLGLIDPGAALYETDIFASMSRDAGATFEAVVLAKIADAEISVGGSPLTVDVVFGEVEFAGANGTDLAWKLFTANIPTFETFGIITDAE